jgi:ABC-2 type transport system ATP-binding protein
LDELAISTRSLRKSFSGNVAVRGLTLDVKRGEVFGFLGPNGAGKSTSIKMLLGLVKPTGGSAELLGYPIGTRSVLSRVGFLPEHFRFYDWLTSTELLQLHGRLCGISENILKRRIPALIDTVGLTPHAGKQIKNFSKGMLQRIGLAQALINEPDLLFLDEPTSGLDPLGRRLVRDLIKAERDRGATVFLNSHLLGEVEVTCDRVAFIKAGAVVEINDMASLAADGRRFLVRADGFSDAILAGLGPLASVSNRNGERLTLTLRSADAAPAVLRHFIQHNVDVFEFTPETASLEDRFLQIVGADQGL